MNISQVEEGYKRFAQPRFESHQIQNQDLQGLMKLYRDEELKSKRRLFLSEAVTSQTAKTIVSDLLILDSMSHEPIHLFLNSPGGEVNSGFSIYDTIRFIESPVTIISTGLCASIATIINIAVPKPRRISMPNTRFLIHQPLISGQVYGQASDIEITATQIIQIREKLNRMLADACGHDFKKVEQDTVRDHWMSAGEALDYGLVGRVVTSQSEIS